MNNRSSTLIVMENIGKAMDISDVTTSALSASVLIAIVGQVVAALHFADVGLGQMLAEYADWYTHGVGAIVVTVNGYLLWRKLKRERNYDRAKSNERQQ